MGFLGGLANVAGLQMANIEANPEQAAVGANTPESTYAMNKTVAPTMDKHYTPTVNMMGGATQGEMQQNAAQGYSNTGPMAANAVGDAAAMYFTGGAATPLVAGQMAADRYSANNPNSTFDREYNGRVLAANANVNAGINQQLNAGVNQGMAMNSYAKGGLSAAAEHLKRHGRGPDDTLVHMSRQEVGALQQIAKAHGGSLTINPSTGLAEAGFLSTILPMAAGALAVATGQVEFLPLIAAGVGAADYAMTGSLQQGLMAGLGTWSGGELTAGLGAAGAADLAEQGANTAESSFNAANQKALEAAGGDEVNRLSAQEVAKSTLGTMNLPAGTSSAFEGAVNTVPESQLGNVIKSAGAASVNPTMGQGLAQGATSFSDIGSALANNKMAALGVAAPLLMGNNLFGNKTVPGLPQQKNPFGMKEIPKDENGNPIFHASLPEPPSPAYKPTYRDYVANPYTPVGSADGGLMQDKLDYASGGMFPGSQIDKTQYAESPQMPASMQQTMAGYDPMTNPLTGEEVQHMADGGMPYIQQAQNQPGTANGYTPAGAGSTYGQGSYSPQTAAAQPMEGGLPMLNQMNPFTQQGMPPSQGVPQMSTPQMPPQTNFAMGGVAKYSGDTDYGSMVSGMRDLEEGIDMATKRRTQPIQHNPEVAIAPDEASIANLDAYNRTLALHKNNLTASHVKPPKGLPQGAVLGSIDLTPAAQAAAEAQAKQSIAGDQGTQEAKEGGVIGMAFGGMSIGPSQTSTPNTFASRIANLPSYGNNLPGMITSLNAPAPTAPINNFAQQGSMQGHIYQPSYANYGQPSQGIPMPTRGAAIPAQGYAMDPLKMQGSPAYNANQAAQQAQLQQIMAAGGMASGGLSGYANGGMSNLGGYSDGGHLLKGPGDGVSDSIPATIGGKQPARLAEGEFVIPARIVSELGNGSTDAGAKRLYAMMDRIKAKRAKTKNIAADTKAYKYLPA